MKNAITVEEAKNLYNESKYSAGREYRRIIAIKGNTMEYVGRTKWSDDDKRQSDYRKLENADLLFDGGY